MRRVYIWLAIAVAAIPAARGQVSIWTGQYDQGRASANLAETILTTSNVNTNQFGLLFTRAVDDYLYAQPLYIPQVTIGGTVHNVVYAATLNNSVYAFDADTPSLSAPLWQVNLGPPATQVVHAAMPHCGILSTPVIDTSTGTMYVVALTEQDGKESHSLHALDITTGNEKFGGPVTIAATVKGTGSDSKNGKINFKSSVELQRPALLLLNGTVYMGFARQKTEDVVPYHGWELGYNATTLKRTFVLNTTPNGNEGGIWMSGRGPAADTNGFTFITGNGDVGNGNIGQSFVRYAMNHAQTGLYTAPNWAALNTNDYDLGAGGPLLIPGTRLLLGGGKTGLIYLLSIASSGALQFRQSVQATPGCSSSSDSSCAQFHSPAFWNLTGSHPPVASLLYIWASNDSLKAFSFTGGLLSTAPVFQNTQTAGLPGGAALALSANGVTPGTGILWAAMSAQDASTAAVPGVLHAFNAANVAAELWNSAMSQADQFGNLAKFSVPVVANGKVYLSTFSNQLAVYGLK
ncbi:MAG: hypothetical protein ACLP59_08240 [Bryobacteraceae bacterium]